MRLENRHFGELLNLELRLYCFFVTVLVVNSAAMYSGIAIAETKSLGSNMEFSYLLPGALPGCSVVRQKKICTAVPITTVPNVYVDVFAGYAQILSTSIVESNCIVITMRLWVDNKGYEGRECLATNAQAVARIEYSTDEDSK